VVDKPNHHRPVHLRLNRGPRELTVVAPNSSMKSWQNLSRSLLQPNLVVITFRRIQQLRCSRRYPPFPDCLLAYIERHRVVYGGEHSRDRKLSMEGDAGRAELTGPPVKPSKVKRTQKPKFEYLSSGWHSASSPHHSIRVAPYRAVPSTTQSKGPKARLARLGFCGWKRVLACKNGCQKLSEGPTDCRHQQASTITSDSQTIRLWRRRLVILAQG
jgi:hypothetical protein